MSTCRLSSIAQRFFEAQFELFPIEAGDLGLHQFDAELGHNSPETYRQYITLLCQTLAEVENLPADNLPADDWLDRRAILAHLRTGLLNSSTLQRWRNNPQIHCDAAIQSIFGLVTRNTGDLQKAVPSIESRLRKIPDFLAAGSACLQKPIPIWTRLAVQSCKGAIEFLTNLGPQLPGPERMSKPIENACSAFKRYAHDIQTKASGPANGYCIGRPHFEFLIRERLGLDCSADEAQALGYALIEQLTAALKKEATKFGRGKPADILGEAAREWRPSQGTLLEEYTAVTFEIKQRFEKAGLVSMPKHDALRVLPVPGFLRHQFPTAAYTSPGPFDKKQVGIFWVNDLSQLQRDPSKKQAEVAQHYGMELTCAHEGYPGHHLQFVLQNRHPSKWRRLFSHSIYYEGWTLWCEKMCVEHGIYRSPHARLAQLHDALWRAWRIVIDCGLHSGDLGHAAAARLLVEGVGFTAGRAKGDINWYTSAPTVPMSYLLGRLELEKLHRHFTRSGWGIRQFNDWVLGFGALPWSWIWEARLRERL